MILGDSRSVRKKGQSDGSKGESVSLEVVIVAIVTPEPEIGHNNVAQPIGQI